MKCHIKISKTWRRCKNDSAGHGKSADSQQMCALHYKKYYGRIIKKVENPTQNQLLESFQIIQSIYEYNASYDDGWEISHQDIENIKNLLK